MKYFGLTLDQKLTWSHYLIRTKRLFLNNRLRKLKIIVLNNNKHTLIKIKLLIGIQKASLSQYVHTDFKYWGSAKKFNLNKIQDFQNIAIRKLTNAPSFVSNYSLY